MKVKIFQQRSPIERNGDYVANIVHIKTIESPCLSDAMDEARGMLVFRCGRGLARWPMLEQEDRPPTIEYPQWDD